MQKSIGTKTGDKGIHDFQPFYRLGNGNTVKMSDLSTDLGSQVFCRIQTAGHISLDLWCVRRSIEGIQVPEHSGRFKVQMSVCCHAVCSVVAVISKTCLTFLCCRCLDLSGNSLV
jgi:hypothetical protein